MSLRRLIRTGLSLCLLIAGTAMAQPVEVPGFTHVRSLGGIDEYRLDANGLTVLAMPDPAATVVSLQVLYKGTRWVHATRSPAPPAAPTCWST